MPSSIDLTDPKDRGLIRTAMTWWPKRWRGLSPEFKDRCVDQLTTAIDEVGNVDDLAKRVATRVDIVRTAAMLEGQNQKDEHHAEGDRVNVTHEVWTVAPPKVLPEPT